MNNLIGMAILIAIIILIPVVLFFSLLGLVMFLWCWRRIGPYLVNFGRWLADWRNLLPCGCMVFVSLILLLVVVPLFLPSALRTVGLVLLVIIIVICGTFAMIVLTARAIRWFWVGYRRQFWRWMNSLWDLLWRRAPERIERRMPGGRGAGRKVATKPPPGKPPSVRRSGLGSFWALMLGRPAEPAQPGPRSETEAGAQAASQPSRGRTPSKQSWFGRFWALMLGKPSRPPTPKMETLKVQTTEQTLGPSGTAAATAKSEASISEAAPSTAPRPDKIAPPKRSWFGAFWSLMLGKPSKSSKTKPGPAKAKTSGQETRPSETATTPERAKKEKLAKRGFFAGMWTSIVRGVTFVVGLVFLGAVWVVQKIREGIEWIRIRLNLD